MKQGQAFPGVNYAVAQSMRYLSQVRWSKAGILQQKAEVTTYGPRAPVSETVWIDVPTEEDQ